MPRAAPGRRPGRAVRYLLSAAMLLQLGCGDERQLTGEELWARFSEHTVEGRHELHGYSFHSYYEAGGVLRSYQDASGQAHIARWWIQGNQICLRWRGQSTDLCRPVVERSGRYYKLLKPGGETIVSFDRFTPKPHQAQ